MMEEQQYLDWNNSFEILDKAHEEGIFVLDHHVELLIQQFFFFSRQGIVIGFLLDIDEHDAVNALEF